jgi:hypothetical protein
MFLVQAHNIQYSVSAVATALASVRPPTSAAHWRRNPTQTLGFLLPWISPWFFVGFLLSPPPYAQSFLRKPSFLVLADFFPWFFKSKQLLGFLGEVYTLKQDQIEILLFTFTI